MGGVIDYCDHKIVETRGKGDEEGPEQVEFEVEGKSFYTAGQLLHRGELKSFYCMLPSDGVERFFEIEPRPDGVEITLVGNQKRMADGSMDFNRQYNYWLPMLHTILVVEGVKFSEFH